ncbi:MAG: copper amine oxidase N-terminal domain-containing protein, partial [Candidatus Eremiobacteraeota bacterium]|nr:copper amine oxidase N-terminal domain-containing protein [Candidatus Eremiobacteraeota bacterium]
MHPHRYKIVVAAAAVAASLLVAGPALAVTVQVNGQTANLNPAPIMRAGRVLVPLRGVFEQLGATVVYQNGSINATGNNRTVSLRIGSTAATVNGQPQNLDVAPFIIGASTYVPLRFVSQALGANVNWDNANQL